MNKVLDELLYDLKLLAQKEVLIALLCIVVVILFAAVLG